MHPSNLFYLEQLLEVPHTNAEGERVKRYLGELIEAYKAQEKYIEDAEQERDEALESARSAEDESEGYRDDLHVAERARDTFERERDELQEQLDELRASIKDNSKQALGELQAMGAHMEIVPANKGRKRK